MGEAWAGLVGVQISVLVWFVRESGAANVASMVSVTTAKPSQQAATTVNFVCTLMDRAVQGPCVAPSRGRSSTAPRHMIETTTTHKGHKSG